jgi:tRNA pseudouridine55 synthase
LINLFNIKKTTYRFKHGIDQSAGQTARTVISEEKKSLFDAGQVICIDKPLHWTSFDVVRKIRGSIGIKKVGHAGTLDPLATGLLIVCTGKFTKKINTYMAAVKEYTGAITLGATTPTYDLESNPENQKDTTSITVEHIRSAAGQLTGIIMQKPPVYSAIKKKGTPLYELARRGEDVELEPRQVEIIEFEIIDVDMPVLRFRIKCSTGTYIRSVAHDLGQILDCGAYLSALRRTAIGDIRVEEAQSMETFIDSLSTQNE